MARGCARPPGSSGLGSSPVMPPHLDKARPPSEKHGNRQRGARRRLRQLGQRTLVATRGGSSFFSNCEVPLHRPCDGTVDRAAQGSSGHAWRGRGCCSRAPGRAGEAAPAAQDERAAPAKGHTCTPRAPGRPWHFEASSELVPAHPRTQYTSTASHSEWGHEFAGV